MKKGGSKDKTKLAAAVDRKKLLENLTRMKSIFSTKSSLPILECVLLRVEKDVLWMACTNLEIAITTRMDVKQVSPGTVCVMGKRLYDVVKGIEDEIINIGEMGNKWLKVWAKGTEFGVVGLDPVEFPSFPEMTGKKVSVITSKILTEVLRKTIFAASSEESRYHLNGVLLETPVDGELRVVGTDGHRLALIQRACAIGKIGGKGVILPKAGALLLLSLLKDGDGYNVSVQIEKSHMFFTTKEFVLAIRLIDGEFPEYPQVIPKDNNRKVVVDRKMLYGILKRLSPLAGRAMGVACLFGKGKVAVRVENPDSGGGKETMRVSYDGEDFQVGFNPDYMMDALNSYEADFVSLEFGKEAETTPIIVRLLEKGSGGQMNIVMPMRI